MRSTITLLLFCSFLPLCAQTETSSDPDTHFRRFMEWAHPTPEPEEGEHRRILPPYILMDTPGSSVFYNTNLIAEESDPLPVQNESSIAVNPVNPLNLIASAVDYRNNSSTWVYVSHDGGKTWENKMLGKPFPDWASSNDPSVAFDSEGRGYFCYGAFNTQTRENGVFLAVTEDEGKTWQAHIPVILHRGVQTKDSVFEDKYYVWLDNSSTSPYFKHAYIPWKRVTDADSATQIVLSKSTDGGKTWSIPVPVGERVAGTSEDTTFGQSFPLAVTGPNGEVYVVWNYGPKHAISFAKSLDGGTTFSTPQLIHTYRPLGTALRLDQGVRHTLKGKVRVETYPTLVCDLTNGSRRGWLYLCWAADSIPDVYFSRSADGGETWSTPVNVHSNPDNDQFWPWLSIDPVNADLAVMYLDSRDDPANLGIHCYVSYSNDGGTTWIDRRISDVQSDLRKNPFQGQAFAGDYSGNAFYNGIVYPSWFDTRNAGASNTDNDVYTAVVNIRIPNPVENLTATILPEEPTELQVQWQGPDKRAFGQPLLPEEATYIVYRNGELVTTLPFATPFLYDTGLTPYERYEYTVAVAAGSDTSVLRTVVTYAGGARQPAVPGLLGWAIPTGEYAAKLHVKIPSVRADSITPLINVLAIRIYRNGTFAKEVPINPTDTSKTLTIEDTTGTQGFYRYAVTIVDASTPANESAISNDILAYTGPVASELDEKFEAATLPPYYNSGVWAIVTALGNRRALTESPDGDYRRLANDTLILFPVRITGASPVVQLEHAALVDPSDSALVEISDDGMTSWRQIGVFTAANYAAWQDDTFDQNDFTIHTLPFAAQPDDVVFVRLRFTSGFSKNEDGWYIDRLTLGNSSTSVGIRSDEQWNIHPNPASTYLMVSWPVDNRGFVTATVTDILGRKQELPVEWSQSGAAVAINTLVPGTYLLALDRENGERVSRLFVVSR